MRILSQLGLGTFLTLAVACTGPRITNISITPTYSHPCLGQAFFEMTVARGNSTPVVTLPRGYIVANGEMIPLNAPSSGNYWGDYSYFGDIPYDGEVRYRYMFRYTSGVPVGSSTNDHVMYNPSDRYLISSVGNINWSSPAASALPDTVVSHPIGTAPRRQFFAARYFPISPPFNGTLTASAPLTITNNESVEVKLLTPELRDRETGDLVTDVTLLPSAGPIQYPFSLAAGASLTYTVSFTATISNSQGQQRRVNAYFPWFGGVGVCRFGPVWITTGVLANPT